jgi:hypothetical protein
MKRLVLAAVAALSLVACGGQSAECKKYIECANAVSAGTGDALASTYGPSGTCWTTTAATATACTDACKSALSSLKAATNPPAACN